MGYCEWISFAASSNSHDFFGMSSTYPRIIMHQKIFGFPFLCVYMRASSMFCIPLLGVFVIQKLVDPRRGPIAFSQPTRGSLRRSRRPGAGSSRGDSFQLTNLIRETVGLPAAGGFPSAGVHPRTGNHATRRKECSGAEPVSLPNVISIIFLLSFPI